MIFCKPKYNGGFKMSEYLPEGKLISEQENINIIHSLKLHQGHNSEGRGGNRNKRRLGS